MRPTAFLFLSLLLATSLPAQTRKVQVEVLNTFSFAGQYRVDVRLMGPGRKMPPLDQQQLSLICDPLGAKTFLPHFSGGDYNPVRETITLMANRINHPINQGDGPADTLVTVSCRVHSHRWWKPEPDGPHGTPTG
jgi:hypothetical protein